jgi:predicted histidine transporter YuiF (NhaC family)
MDKLDTVLASIAQQLADATVKYGPDAAALAGSVLQLEAIRSLLIFIPVVIGLIVVLSVCYYHTRNYKKYLALDNNQEYGKHKPQRECYGTVAILSGIASVFWSVVTLAVAFNSILNPIYWAAAYDWRVAIAAKVLGYL